MPRFHKNISEEEKNSSSRDRLTRILDMLLLVHKKETGIKSRSDMFLFKIRMIITNIIANTIGIFIMRLLLYSIGFRPSDYGFGVISSYWFNVIAPVPYIIGVFLLIRYESPIWKVVSSDAFGKGISDETRSLARKRALNEPFFIATINLMLWLLAGAGISLMYYLAGIPPRQTPIPFFAGLNTGLITSACSFFFAEHVTQYHTIPYMFPNGDVSTTAGAYRIRIITRLFGLFLAINIIPFLAQIQFMHLMTHIYPELTEPTIPVRMAVFFSSLIFIGVGFFATLQVGFNMSMPFHDIMGVLKAISEGDMDKRAQVSSNDEIGYTAEMVNEMAKGLKERERLSRSLDLAREVQQNLIPENPPDIQGLDIAGRSIFCDETGGDYFDFIKLGDNDPSSKAAVIIGDVSDHGLQAALLMISARAYLRHHACHSDNLSEITADVNGHMVEDVKDSGRFMTMFIAVVDTGKKSIRWVRAGHDPGILYDPIEDRFEELGGKGLPLGAYESSDYKEYSRNVSEGQIIILATDGVWEARDPQGSIFGKERMMDMIREKSGSSALEIMEAILESLAVFTCSTQYQDDVTVVVVKITG